MKKIVRILFLLLLTQQTYAQHVYQIRADSVRITNSPATAELIIENRTQDTLGFLFNKGKGRTEFRKLKLKDLGNGKIAIVGQDTVSINISATKAVDSLWRKGDSIAYRMSGKNYAVFAPVVLSKLGDVNIQNFTNGNLLRYNSNLSKWESKVFSDTMLGRGEGYSFYTSKVKKAISTYPHFDSIGLQSISLGDGALAKLGTSIAIGRSARVSGTGIGGIAIGDSATVNTTGETGGTGGVAIGWKAISNGDLSIAVGANANVTGSQGIAIGNASSAGATALAIGGNARATNNNTAIGTNASASSGPNSTAIGYSAQSVGVSSVAIGAFSKAASGGSIAIGYRAYAKLMGSIALVDYDPDGDLDSANVFNGFFSRFRGGYALYTDGDFSLRQYSDKTGNSFFRSNSTSTMIGNSTTSSTSRLSVNGSLALPMMKTTTDTTLGVNDYRVIVLSIVNIYLPDASIASKRIYVIKNAATAGITINAAPGKVKNLDTDTATNYTLPSGSSITLQSDGADWWIIN